jgi:hypothetical protein
MLTTAETVFGLESHPAKEDRTESYRDETASTQLADV